jgi:hypothetical protein
MKNLILPLLLIAFGISSNAQSIIAQNAQPLNSQDLMLSKSSNKVEGSAYLNDDDTLMPGLVLVGSDKKATYFMRYNVLNDRIEFSENMQGENLMAMPKQEDMVIQLRADKFQYLDFSNVDSDLKGYFKIIKAFDAENLLVAKYTKELVEPDEKAKSTYSTKQYARIVDSFDFYFIEDGDIMEVRNHKRRVLKSLDEDKEDEVKDFIKDRDIEFEDDGKGLAEVLAYYLSLK